jgi:hypothetical protein
MGARRARAQWALVAGALVVLMLADEAWGTRISDVRGTLHNLSASGPGSVKSASESQVCVFCHTPHAATPGPTPLWNRALSGSTYTVYTSSSLDANAIQGALDQPGGSSKLCLSCHDGTLAIGNVNVLNGQGSVSSQGTISIPLVGTGAGGTIPPGAGTMTGFTRNLGIVLTNDHPISVNFTNALAQRDGELRPVDANQKWPPGVGDVLGVRSPAYKPLVPLEPTGAGGTGQVQCGSCHDPHVRETDATLGSQKFLRHNRFQQGPPSASFDQVNDIICLACHDKNQQGVWAFSAHANPLVATETYTTTAAGTREFPQALPVWKAACLNCHDTHTVQGARRLLREGTDSVTTPKSGGNAAMEETCYQCHFTSATSAVTPTTTVPNIGSDFQAPRHMPITSAEQAGGTEAHDVGGNFADAGFTDCTSPSNRCGADLVESRANLGVGNLANRHAECTDCHNPHRVVKFRSVVGTPPGSISGIPDAGATHPHTDTAGFTHTNVASGALRGSVGVEPIYGSASFQSLPISYLLKRGDPGSSADTSVAAAYVTREYQICLRCHSDYGYGDSNAYPTANRPNLGPPGTPSGTNNLTQYTNQAKEFQAPLTHKGEVTTLDSGAAAAFSSNNHRSWHPVTDDTGRTPAARGGVSPTAIWNLPWSNAVGSQSMYCTDCHGSNVTSATSVVPDGGENGNPWGPHGSANDFLLKGQWNTSTGTGQQGTGLCFKCHNYTVYATRARVRTGFWLTDVNEDGHSFHADKIGRMRCNWCHVAVPHGWKNKALLVNLNDVGAEAGQPAGTQVRNNTTALYNQQPYYMNSALKIRNFKASGQWTAADCGSSGAPGNGQSGTNWMKDSSENCANPP